MWILHVKRSTCVKVLRWGTATESISNMKMISTYFSRLVWLDDVIMMLTGTHKWGKSRKLTCCLDKDSIIEIPFGWFWLLAAWGWHAPLNNASLFYKINNFFSAKQMKKSQFTINQSIAGIFIVPLQNMDGSAWQCINVNIQAFSDTKNKVKNKDNTHIANKETTISNAINLRVQQRLKQSSKRRRLEGRVQTLSDAWRWRQQVES